MSHDDLWSICVECGVSRVSAGSHVNEWGYEMSSKPIKLMMVCVQNKLMCVLFQVHVMQMSSAITC